MTARAKAWAGRAARGPPPASRAGVTRAAGLPEAGAWPSSMTVTSRPSAGRRGPWRRRRSRRRSPPGDADARGAGGAPGKSASSRSFLRPKPGRLSTRKPAAAEPRRTAPATVKVAARAPGALRAATAARISSRHMAGFRAGEKPSRNQASAAPSQAAEGRPRRPSPPGRTIASQLGQVDAMEAAGAARPVVEQHLGARSPSSGQTARARAASSGVIGWASIEKTCRRWPGSSVGSPQVQQGGRMFRPVPKPSSPTTKRSRPRQAAGRSQPARNTARVSARPSVAGEIDVAVQAPTAAGRRRARRKWRGRARSGDEGGGVAHAPPYEPPCFQEEGPPREEGRPRGQAFRSLGSEPGVVSGRLGLLFGGGGRGGGGGRFGGGRGVGGGRAAAASAAALLASAAAVAAFARERPGPCWPRRRRPGRPSTRRRRRSRTSGRRRRATGPKRPRRRSGSSGGSWWS